MLSSFMESKVLYLLGNNLKFDTSPASEPHTGTKKEKKMVLPHTAIYCAL